MNFRVGESSRFYFLMDHPGVWRVKPDNQSVTSKGRGSIGIDMGGYHNAQIAVYFAVEPQLPYLNMKVLTQPGWP